MSKYKYPEMTITTDGQVYCHDLIEARSNFCDVDVVCDNCPLLIILARYEYCKTHESQKSVQ